MNWNSSDLDHILKHKKKSSTFHPEAELFWKPCFYKSDEKQRDWVEFKSTQVRKNHIQGLVFRVFSLFVGLHTFFKNVLL